MPTLAFEGPAGTGKTYRLIEEVRARALELEAGQRVLGLTFMHGSRRRLEASFSSNPEIHGRGHVTTIDSFAAHVVRRWSSIVPDIPDFSQFDLVCDACGVLLERPEIARWVSSTFPTVAIDEAQELKPCRLRIARALSNSTSMIVAADEFQCLEDQLDTGPFMEWLATGNVRHLVEVRRTRRQGLLRAGVALRAGRAPTDGAGLRIRYEFPAQMKFAIGHALRDGAGTRAVLFAPGSAAWATQLIPQLAAGLRSNKQNIPPLPVVWEANSAIEVTEIAESLCGAAEQVECVELVQRMKMLNDPPPWVPMAATSVEMARRAHGIVLWTRADLLTLCSRKANIQRAYGYSSDYGIRVMTIQAAKNRQFRDVVVLWGPGVPGSIDYQRRLLYNAISRAEYKCTVFVRTKQQLLQVPFI